jgi:hypothetical protein
VGEKIVYNIDGKKSATDWVKEDVKKIKTQDAPQMTSGINYKPNKEGCRGNLIKNALGFYYNNSNNVDKNAQNVGMFTSCFSSGTGCSIIPNNFHKCTALFTARKLVEKTWINSKDEYIAPNEVHESWKTFVADSVVYSLFHSASNQSSLRHIDYKGSKWDIKNEFFFMSKDVMSDLANETGNDDMYNDCSGSDERFVYLWLEEHQSELSPMGKAVLKKAEELVITSMKYRALFNEEHEEYQINNWDCGWYQLKAMFKVFMPNELKEFNELYKEFAKQLKPMVYELGFLK